MFQLWTSSLLRLFLARHARSSGKEKLAYSCLFLTLSTIAPLGTAAEVCDKYPLGISKTDLNGQPVVISISREESLSDSTESLRGAAELALMSAKFGLATHFKSNTIRGVRKHFQCTDGQWVYIGVFVNVATLVQSQSVKDEVATSVERTATPAPAKDK